MAALSLQGPKSRAVLNRCCAEPLDKLKYFRMMQNTHRRQRPVTISRTGYTGDLGYEIWMDVADALPIWDALMAAGDDYGITPCGILAMDMARVEAGLFMIDVDYTAANHAWIDGPEILAARDGPGLGGAISTSRATSSAAARSSASSAKARRGSWWASRSTGKAWSGCSPRSACRRRFPAWRCAAACR